MCGFVGVPETKAICESCGAACKEIGELREAGGKEYQQVKWGLFGLSNQRALKQHSMTKLGLVEFRKEVTHAPFLPICTAVR